MAVELRLLIESGHRIITIETTDEARAVEAARKVAQELVRPLCEWSITRGLTSRDERGDDRVVEACDALKALAHVAAADEPAIYAFKDLGSLLADQPFLRRQLRELQNGSVQHQGTLILIDPNPLPDSVRRFTVPFQLGWPEADELRRVVISTFRRIKAESLTSISSHITEAELESLIQALRGLSCSEVERVVATAVLDDGILLGDDLKRIVEAKRYLLGSTGCLDSINADVPVEELGGLDHLKAWLRQRRNGFSRRAREFGLDPPKGILLLGVQGCGKSLAAKVVASDWKMPLLRLDPGALYQKFVGESESRLRQALRQAEAMAPVVLWIDEIEKAFASAEAASADGGLSQRIFGTLLSWMQDHPEPIFLVATANNVSALPPELMRKGRFDEVFFVDLPGPSARARIFAVHLKRRNREPDRFDLLELAAHSDGFSGAEIEQATLSALYAAFQAGEELANRHILAEMAITRPLSVLMSERVRELREWARDRCVPAD